MGRLRTIARRTFLVGSAAVVGGVVFGYYLVRRPHDNPLNANLADGETAFNPWVKIGPSGITVIAPHTDLGQGARSMQGALIAEELDLEFGRFDVEVGVPAAAYYNRALAAETAPFRQRDTGFLPDNVRALVGAVSKVAGLQVTGGSTSVPDSYDKLRMAGAVARETLKQAAAIRTDIDVARLATKAGAVVLPDGTRIPYVDLAVEASAIEPVTDVSLRDPSTWRLLGKPMQRLDIVGKSTGTLDYGIDLSIDGMVNATVRFNPRQGGAMISYDAATALTMPGVKKIVEVTNGVAVVADNTWNAFQAANAVTFDWGPAPYPAESAQHWEEVAASFSRDRLDKTWRDDGDVETALTHGDAVSAEYRAPYVAHAPLEPISALVLAADERVDIWVGHQLPRLAQNVVADIAGVDVDQVFLHNQYCGGSFGHRLEFENVRYATEVAVQMKGTPVKLTFSREEDFAHDYLRQIGMSRMQGRVVDGRIDTLAIDVATPSAAASQFSRIEMPAAGPDTQIPAGVWDAPYAIQNLRVRAFRVPELAPTSSWRSVGASTGGFFLEMAIDELAVSAGEDPLQARLQLCDDPIARSVLEAAGEMSGWGTPLAENRGRGVALVFSFGVYVAEVVEVTDTPQGIRIDKVFVATDVGPVLDPIAFENQVQGGVVWGLGHAMNCEITFADGKAEQSNYHMHTAMRFRQCPRIEVRALENNKAIRGIGEPPVPPAAPALANAIFDATGRRLREMPFNKAIKFA